VKGGERLECNPERSLHHDRRQHPGLLQRHFCSDRAGWRINALPAPQHICWAACCGLTTRSR
jgi:hypothetical protein